MKLIKRLFLYALVLSLCTAPVLAGYNHYGYGSYSQRDPHLIFSFDAKHQTVRDQISLTALSQTYVPTNRNRINSAGNLEAVAANTPVIDHIGASLTPALLVQPQAMQLLLGSNNFSVAGGYTLSNATTAQNAVGPSGAANEAWTVTDASAAAVGQFNKAISKSSSDSTTYFLGCFFVKKTVGATVFPYISVQFAGVATKDTAYFINTNTGATVSYVVSSANPDTLVIGYEGFWIVFVWAQDNGANNIARLWFGPAITSDLINSDSTLQGSCVIANGMLTTGSIPIPSSYFAGAAAQGAEQSSGNLTVGKSYIITARDTADFTLDGAPNNNVSTYFIATGTNVTLDATNKVKEHGTVRATEAGSAAPTMAFDAAQTAALSGTTGQGAIVWIPGASKAALSANHNIFAWNTGATNGIYLGSAAGAITISDGTNTATTAYSYVANTPCVITWYWEGGKIKIGAFTVAASSVTWGSEANYDGSFNPGANAIFGAGTSLQMPNRYPKVNLWSARQSDAKILTLN